MGGWERYRLTCCLLHGVGSTEVKDVKKKKKKMPGFPPSGFSPQVPILLDRMMDKDEGEAVYVGRPALMGCVVS